MAPMIFDMHSPVFLGHPNTIAKLKERMEADTVEVSSRDHLGKYELPGAFNFLRAYAGGGRRLFAEWADTPTLVIGTHYAAPTAGRKPVPVSTPNVVFAKAASPTTASWPGPGPGGVSPISK